MTTYQVGQSVVWGLAVVDAAGTAADVGTGPVATVTLPDATTALATVVKASTGNYVATLTSTQVGRHTCTWTGSGLNSGGLPYVDVADVWPLAPRLIISLADARNALNVTAGSRVHDDELLGHLVAAGIVIEHLVGTVLKATLVESHSGRGRTALALHQMPTAITSVVESGTTLGATDYCYDEAGLLWRGSSPGAGSWASGARNVVVTYTAGSPILPENVRLAAAQLVAHWWRQTQQSYRPYMGGGGIEEPGATMIAGYAVPNFVVDLLTPSMSNRMPGFA